MRFGGGAVFEGEEADSNQSDQYGGGGEASERKAAVVERFVEKITNNRAERSRQDERRPEEGGAVDAFDQIESGDNNEQAAEDQHASAVAESGVVGRPVAERRSQRLRKHDGGPVKHFGFG